ncbi:hypothetical protein OAK26_05355 [Gammaproteobacteria bacterium]|nr:hypothetical protein [Gammaproteobacteria bacterium]
MNSHESMTPIDIGLGYFGQPLFTDQALMVTRSTTAAYKKLHLHDNAVQTP